MNTKSILVAVASITLLVARASADEPRAPLRLYLLAPPPPPAWARTQDGRDNAKVMVFGGVALTVIGAGLVVGAVSVTAARFEQTIDKSVCTYNADGWPSHCEYAPEHDAVIGMIVGGAVGLGAGVPLWAAGQGRLRWLEKHHAELQLSTTTTGVPATSAALRVRF